MPKKSRKQRSKQRRHGNGRESESRGYDPYSLVHGLSPAQAAVAAIRSGDGAVTRGHMYSQTETAETEVKYRQQLNDLGLVDVLLGFLQRCEGPFGAVELTAPEHVRSITAPYQWVNVLNSATTDGATDGVVDEEKMSECRLRVAGSISPLVHCMCREERRLFRSNVQWHWALDGFVRLIGNCALNREARKILLGYDGLVETLAQLVFVQSHRPDIAQEAEDCITGVAGFMKTDYYGTGPDGLRRGDSYLSRVASRAEKIVGMFVRGHSQKVDQTTVRFCEADQRFLGALAACPILQRSTNGPASEAPFVIELASLLNTRSTRDGRVFPIETINMLAAAARESAVSIDLVEAVVGFGIRGANCLEEAHGITQIVFGMLQPNTGTFTRVSDHRMSVAIKAGLLQMCLKFAVDYGDQEDPRPDKEDHMTTKLWHLANSCHVIALHKQSSKAIAVKRGEIESSLAGLGVDSSAYCRGTDQSDDNSTVTNTFLVGCKHSYSGGNDSIRCVVQAVWATLHISTTNCCNCLKLIESAAVKRCSNCKKPVYCSRQCQAQHWKVGGHKLDCKRMGVVNSLTVMGEGEKHVAKANDLESNIIVACNKLFLENIRRILQQANHMGCEILDCIVAIELNHQAPFIKLFAVKNDILTEYGIERDHFDHNSSKGALTCAYRSNVFNTGEREAGKRCANWPVTDLYQTFPGSLAPHGSWKEAQAKVGRCSEEFNEQQYFGGPSKEDYSEVDRMMEMLDQGLKQLEEQYPGFDLSKARANIRERIIHGETPTEAFQESCVAAVKETMMNRAMENLFRDS